jgi:hypothetical protein
MAQEIHFILYNLPEGDSSYKLLSKTAKYDIFNKNQQLTLTSTKKSEECLTTHNNL